MVKNNNIYTNSFKSKKMKKLVLFAAVIVAVSFASCKKQAEAPAEEATVETVAPDTTSAIVTADSTVADTTAAVAE